MKRITQKQSFDAVEVEVFNNRISSIVEEMGANLVLSLIHI